MASQITNMMFQVTGDPANAEAPLLYVDGLSLNQKDAVVNFAVLGYDPSTVSVRAIPDLMFALEQIYDAWRANEHEPS